MASHDHEHNHKHKPKPLEDMTLQERGWYGWLMKDFSMAPPGLRRAFALQSGFFRILPSNPRCASCRVPFEGIGGAVMGPFGFRRSDLSPKLCDSCVSMVRKEQIGVEIPLAMLFADVCGSTAMAETMSPSEFQKIINRFYTETTDVLIEHDALIERLMGDQVTGHFVPGIAGPEYPAQAVKAAQALLDVTGHGDSAGPWIEVGVGVHVGIAYVGSVGSADGVSGITALGDDVNTAARLASHAATGEIVLSDAICEAAGVDVSNLESRTLELKGKSAPFAVRIMRIAAPQGVPHDSLADS